MATKLITLELDAYEKLRAAKRGRESFSSVVRRCILPGGPKSGSALLEHLRSRVEYLSEAELAAIDVWIAIDPANPAKMMECMLEFGFDSYQARIDYLSARLSVVGL